MFHETLVIHKLEGEENVPAGVYRCPFSFYLPASLPPSLHFEDKSCGSASVEYCLTVHFNDPATVVTSRMITLVAAPHNHHKTTDETAKPSLKPASSFSGTTFLQEPKVVPLKTFGNLLDQGRVLVAARVLTTHIGKGQKLTCGFVIHNQSKQDIERVDLQLQETIDWKAFAHEKQKTVVIAQELEIITPGIHPDAAKNPEYGDTIDSGMFSQMLADTKWTQNTVELKIPQKAIESYRGKLMTIHHSLKLLVYWKGRLQHPMELMAVNIRVSDPPLLDDAGHLKNHHHTRKNSAEDAQIKWPDDEELLLEAKEELAPVDPLREENMQE